MKEHEKHVAEASRSNELDCGSPASVPYKPILLESLKDKAEAAAYIVAASEDEDDRVFALAIQDVYESWQAKASTVELTGGARDEPHGGNNER